MESRYLTTEALVLKHYPLNESDRSVILLAPGVGKIRAVARGAKKLTSPFNGRLSPLNHIRVVMYKTPRGTWTITQCESIELWPIIKDNFFKTTTAITAIDIIARSTEINGLIGSHEHSIDSLYSEVMSFLNHLNIPSKREKDELLFLTYQARILDILGVLPSFKTCSKCHRKIDIETMKNWCPKELLCEACESEKKQNFYHPAYDSQYTLPMNFLKLMNFIRTKTHREIRNIHLTHEQKNILKTIFQMLWNDQSSSTPKSLEILESLHA